MKYRVLNAFHLKLITVLAMVVGSILMQSSYPAALLAAEEGIEAESTAFALFQAGYALYIAVMPIAGFLLVEGLMRTSNRRKMLIRLAVAAILSQLLISGVHIVTGATHYPAYRLNFFFTMLLASAAILAVERKLKKYQENSFQYNLFSLLLFLAAAIVAVLLGTEYSHTGVMTIIAIYMFRSNVLIMTVAIAALQLLLGTTGIVAYAPVIGILCVLMYNGKQGIHGKAVRIVFYAAYPVAYAVLQLVLKFLV